MLSLIILIEITISRITTFLKILNNKFSLINIAKKSQLLHFALYILLEIRNDYAIASANLDSIKANTQDHMFEHCSKNILEKLLKFQKHCER